MSSINPAFEMNVSPNSGGLTTLRISVASPVDWGAPPDETAELPSGAMSLSGIGFLMSNDLVLVLA